MDEVGSPFDRPDARGLLSRLQRASGKFHAYAHTNAKYSILERNEGPPDHKAQAQTPLERRPPVPSGAQFWLTPLGAEEAPVQILKWLTPPKVALRFDSLADTWRALSFGP